MKKLIDRPITEIQDILRDEYDQFRFRVNKKLGTRSGGHYRYDIEVDRNRYVFEATCYFTEEDDT